MSKASRYGRQKGKGKVEDMKKILAVFLMMVMVVSFAACSGKDSDGTQTLEPAEEPAIKGEVYNAGNVSALVPEGWMLVEGSDIFQEYTDIGHNPNSFAMYKGATDELSVFSCCALNIYYSDGSMYIYKDFYDDVVDLAEQKIGNYTWQGFTYTSIGYPGVCLYTGLDADGKANGDQIQVSITLENGDKKITMDDPDGRAVLESIKHEDADPEYGGLGDGHKARDGRRKARQGRRKAWTVGARPEKEYGIEEAERLYSPLKFYFFLHIYSR